MSAIWSRRAAPSDQRSAASTRVGETDAKASASGPSWQITTWQEKAGSIAICSSARSAHSPASPCEASCTIISSWVPLAALPATTGRLHGCQSSGSGSGETLRLRPADR